MSATDDEGPDAADLIEAEIVSYVGRRAPLRADLAAGTAGADRLTGVRHLTGGEGRDALRGSDRDEWLTGQPAGLAGGDVLIGRGGDDTLRGGHGRDVLLGGDGDDTLAGRQGPDRYDGGPGHDVLEFPAGSLTDPGVLRCGPGRDLLSVPRRVRQPLDCEGRALDPVDPGLGIHVWLERRGPLVVRVTLARPWSGARWCRAAVDLRTARRRVTVDFGGLPDSRGRSRRLVPPLRAAAIRSVGFRRSYGCRERTTGTRWRAGR